MHEGEDRLAPEVQQSFIDNRVLEDGEGEAEELPVLTVESDADDYPTVKRRRHDALDDVPL